MNNDKNKYKKPRWLTAEKEFYPHVKAIRDELKQEMTPAEKILWEHLRNKKLGVKFRRQHVIDVYIPDFVSLPIKLIVEVDGKIHLKRLKEDSERTQKLENLGYRVIRFENEQVENNIDEVLSIIKINIEELNKLRPHLTSPKERNYTPLGDYRGSGVFGEIKMLKLKYRINK